MVEEMAERSQQAHLVGPPGPGVEWGLICANALMCCEAKFLHLTLGIGDHLLYVHIHAPCFVKIAEMPIVRHNSIHGISLHCGLILVSVFAFPNSPTVDILYKHFSLPPLHVSGIKYKMYHWVKRPESLLFAQLLSSETVHRD